MTLSPVTIQITPEERPSTPAWMGEVVASGAFAYYRSQHSLLNVTSSGITLQKERHLGSCAKISNRYIRNLSPSV